MVEYNKKKSISFFQMINSLYQALIQTLKVQDPQVVPLISAVYPAVLMISALVSAHQKSTKKMKNQMLRQLPPLLMI